MNFVPTSFTAERVTLFVFALASLVACGDDSTGPGGSGRRLKLVIGDIEGTGGPAGCVPETLDRANSLDVGTGISGPGTRTFAALTDTSGAATSLSFVLDAGGDGATDAVCRNPGDELEADGITENGPTLHKPWHIEGLEADGRYRMTFTGGGFGSVRRSLRIFVDVDADGTIEPTEVEDLIGLDGVIETRTFGQTIHADADGMIHGEYWGGSTNQSGENGAWRGWSILQIR